MDFNSDRPFYVKVKQERDVEEVYQCDFCSSNFQTKEERKSHTIEHFQTKFCTKCNKFLIKIVDDWFEQHTDVNCTNEILNCDKNERKFIEIDQRDKNDVKKKYSTNQQCTVELEIQPSTFFYSIEEDSVHDLVPNNSNTIKSSIKNKTQFNKCWKTNEKLKNPLLFREIEKSTDLNEIIDKFKCDICDKLLSTKASIRSHMNTIHNPNEKAKRSATCDTCGRSFVSSGNLKLHQKTHMESKEFICSYCGHGFNQLNQLQEHINVHEGKKPWICKLCFKGFSRRSHLNSHKRVHTREKPYKCTIEQCERAYMYKIDLNRHKYSVHGIYTKKHICPICSKVYSENKLLQKHLEAHKKGDR